jgi:hypothetical protein
MSLSKGKMLHGFFKTASNEAVSLAGEEIAGVMEKFFSVSNTLNKAYDSSNCFRRGINGGKLLWTVSHKILSLTPKYSWTTKFRISLMSRHGMSG